MWQLIGPAGTIFPGWEETNPPLVYAGLGDDYPPGFGAFLESKGIVEGEFRELLSNVVEVVYCNAYGAADSAKTLQFILDAIKASERWGGRCPDVSRFKSSWWADNHGWGSVLSWDRLGEWRKTTSTRDS
jgi:hypothetical protein